jgi:hypothetical protein
MKRIIGLLVLGAALSSGALALAGDSMAKRQACSATCTPGSGSCPIPCGGSR